MSSFLDKMQVNSAITSKTKLDLSHQHITTSDFMQLCPVMTYEMSPTQKISGSFEAFARLNPLPVPTFGRANIHFNKFFVPYRTLMGAGAWDDFITDAVHVTSSNEDNSAILSQIPCIKNSTFVNEFVDSHSAGVINVNDSSSILTAMLEDNAWVWEIAAGQVTPGVAYDFALREDDVTNPVRYFRFTNRGRLIFKIIESLGYKVVWYHLKDNDPKDFALSALPLLALCRIYVDWYYPSAYHDMFAYDKLVSLLKRDNSNFPYYLLGSDLTNIFNWCCYVQYDSDLFTACFDNPVGPNDNNYSSFNIVDPTLPFPQGQGGVYSAAGSNGTPFVARDNSISSNLASFSQYTLTALRSLSDYLTRHRLAGSQAYQRYLARFGKALPFSSRNRSVFCGRDIQPLQIGDVMSSSDTDGANLGAYAGKGLSYGTCQFDYETDEYGLYVVMMSIVPATGYYQGIDGTLFHRNRLDFFTPEFDQLGCAPVRSSQLFIPLNSSNVSTLDVNHIFGYLPRYYELKTKTDRLTGNFRLGSINGSHADDAEFNAANSWHLFRSFDSDDYPTSDTIVHNPQFLRGQSDALQYKRIFFNSAPDAPDNFTIILNFNLFSIAPMASLFDTYEFDDKGSKVTLDVNGQKLN